MKVVRAAPKVEMVQVESWVDDRVRPHWSTKPAPEHVSVQVVVVDLHRMSGLHGKCTYPVILVP